MRTGIWLDKQNAFIVKIDQDVESLVVLKSEIDNKDFEKDLNQLKEYSNSILHEVDNTEELVLVGQEEMLEHFHKHIESTNKNLFDKVIAVREEDNITENQIKSYVKNFFIREIKV